MNTKQTRRIRTFSAKRNGFTLIELLVVVAIISLLVSILLPSLQKAKELAKSVTCLSNLKNIGMGFAIYENENDGAFPFAAQAPMLGNPDFPHLLPNLQVLLEYIFPRTEEFICNNRPQAPALNAPWYRSPIWGCPKDELNSNWFKNYGSSYTYISRAGNPPTSGWGSNALCDHTVSEVGEPSSAIMVMGAGMADPAEDMPHGNGYVRNGVCVDGHAQDIELDDVGIWNFTTQQID